MATDQLGRNVSQLITRIRRYLKQPDESKSNWDNNFIRQMLNSNYRMRCTELHLAHEGQFINVAFRDLEKNKARYEWPPGWTRTIKLELVRTDGRTVPLRRYERHFDPNPDEGSSGDSYLPTYRPLSGGFVLEPKPTTTVSSGLRIEYHGIPPEITSNNDKLSDDFPEMFDELLVLDTVVGLYHAEELQESGLQRTFMTWRMEWEFKWNQYVYNRTTSQQRVVPFVPHYHDY